MFSFSTAVELESLSTTRYNYPVPLSGRYLYLYINEAKGSLWLQSPQTIDMQPRETGESFLPTFQGFQEAFYGTASDNNNG